ncbi:MAG TPA: glycosyltransferase family 4 protein [Candidatus Saccharimonadales bacterium]|jgi:phosphatidylinositol alpha-mannosyltransferase|nr:glycosyltransferase family 4 protein [Candidatus Saccharimonadales bacterium]
MKMKIGLVCPYSIERSGGVLEVVLALRQELTARGHDVKIITPAPRNPEMVHPDYIIFAGTSVDFRTLSFSDTTSQVSSTADSERIDALLAEEKFDILHFHEPWMPLLSRQLLQRSNAVNIGTFHAKVSDALMSRAILKIVTPYLNSVLKYLHELTAVSDAGASYVAGMTDQPITIIPNGIDLKKYHPSKVKKGGDEPKTILYIGRLERRKGAKHLLQAYGLLTQSNRDMRLLIVGDGPDREKLELLAEDLQLPNVSFLGFVDEKLKQQLLRETDLFCSPALYGESFGIVLLEAMASGAVSVAGNNGGYSGLMKGPGAISIVNPTDTEEFARRLQLLLYEPELRHLWKSWARQYIKQYSYPRIVDRYEEFYQEALERHGH